MAKTKNVTIIHELPDGTEKPEAVVIKRVKVRHINRTFSALSNILDGFAANPELEQVVFDILSDETSFDPAAYPDATKEELKVIEEEYSSGQTRQWAMAALKSGKFLLHHLPEQIAELVSSMSNIDKEVLLDQEPEVFADVVEAIWEVNDVLALWERGKQVFGVTVKAFQSEKKKAQAENNQPVPALQ